MCQNTVLGPVYGKETAKSEDPKSSSKQVNKEKSSSFRKEMSLSSGKQVFDGGWAGIKLIRHKWQEKEDGCQLGDTWPMATLCTKSWINHMRHINCSLKPSFAHENCLIFAGIGSGLHCYHFFIFTSAYALTFIHRCFGSLSQRLGVLISFGGSA